MKRVSEGQDLVTTCIRMPRKCWVYLKKKSASEGITLSRIITDYAEKSMEKDSKKHLKIKAS